MPRSSPFRSPYSRVVLALASCLACSADPAAPDGLVGGGGGATASAGTPSSGARAGIAGAPALSGGSPSNNAGAPGASGAGASGGGGRNGVRWDRVGAGAGSLPEGGAPDTSEMPPAGAPAKAGAGGAPGAAGGGAVSPVSWPLVNGIQWADTSGKAIQAHGGGILLADGYYYWFGENRNPNSTFHAVSAYRSKDLVRWEFVNDVLRQSSDPGLDPANVERPKVVYNASTKKYVMWMHWENGEHYGEARAAVASSDTVAGDYTYHGSFRPYADEGIVDHDRPGYMSRDCTLFVDDDGKAYFLSASNENYDLNLYELTPDYLKVERLVAVLFKGGHREAPALFKRDGIYFLLTSGATGWDPNQAKYATSRSLASGWSEMTNVADGNTFYSQSTFVLPVQGSAGTAYLYLGDRWAGAWSGRVNDSTYVWQPISFPSATSMRMTFGNTLQIDAAAGTLSGENNNFRFINVKSGKALDVEDASTENSGDLVQMPVSDAKSQVWSLNYDGAGFFRITNLNSERVIDVPDQSAADGIELVQWERNDGDNQAFRLVDVGNGRFKILNKQSNKVAAVVGGSTADGAAVEQRTSGSGEEQEWRLVVAE